MRTLSVDEQTFKRLASVMQDMMHAKKRDIDYSDVLNELINVYHDSQAFSGENAGG